MPDFKPGDETTLNGKRVRIKSIYPDGTADIEPIDEGMSVKGFVQNAGSDLVDQVKGMAQGAWNTMRHPGDTLKMVAGLVSPEYYPELPSTAEALASDYKQAYGSPSALGQTLYEHPFRVASDVAMGLGAAGGVLKLANMPRAAAGMMAASDAINPATVVMKPAGKLLRGAGIGMAEATVRPPKAVKSQQQKAYEASEAIVRHGVMSSDAAAAKSKIIQQKLEDAAVASPTTTNVASLVQFPKTRANLQKDAIRADNITALDAFRDAVIAENPATIGQSRLLEIKRSENRLANPEFRFGQRDMPGGDRPVIGDAHKEFAQTASRRFHNNVPGSAEMDDTTRRLILAEGAWKNAETRPHLMSKMLAGGALTGSMFAPQYAQYSIPAALSVLALDSPKVGAAAGIPTYWMGRGMGSDQAIRAMLLARMNKQTPSE